MPHICTINMAFISRISNTRSEGSVSTWASVDEFIFSQENFFSSVHLGLGKIKSGGKKVVRLQISPIMIVNVGISEMASLTVNGKKWARIDFMKYFAQTGNQVVNHLYCTTLDYMVRMHMIKHSFIFTMATLGIYTVYSLSVLRKKKGTISFHPNFLGEGIFFRELKHSVLYLGEGKGLLHCLQQIKKNPGWTAESMAYGSTNAVAKSESSNFLFHSIGSEAV